MSTLSSLDAPPVLAFKLKFFLENHTRNPAKQSSRYRGRTTLDLLEPLQQDMLTFESVEWDQTSDDYEFTERLLFGGPLSAMSPTPMWNAKPRKLRLEDPLACPSGGTILELPLDEEEMWDMDVDDEANICVEENYYPIDTLPHCASYIQVVKPGKGCAGGNRSPISPRFNMSFGMSKGTEFSRPTRTSLRASAH
ncbi:hypothetical protein H0H92_012015 [Tricholoma furcatifolium]|nr:hypothetical protein H0H92_012015 [Tricholoma furcatifolium]